MKKIAIFLSFLFIYCTVEKPQNLSVRYPDYEHLNYTNYKDKDSVILKGETFDILDEINFNDFQNLINKNANHYKSIEWKSKTKYFFNVNDESTVKIHILFKINNPEFKQYLGYISTQDNIYEKDIYLILNVIEDRVKSSFVAFNELDYHGFGYEINKVLHMGDNNYKLWVYGVSDAKVSNNKKNPFEIDYTFCFKLKEDGYITPSEPCNAL